MEKTYRVTGMTCSGCQNKISKTLNSIDGIHANVNLEDSLVKIHSHQEISLDELRKTWMSKLNDNCIFISAKTKENIDEFRETLYKKVMELHVQKYPYNDFLYQKIDDE